MKNIGHFSARVSPAPLMPHAVHAGLRRACHRFSCFSLIAAAALTLAACVSNVPAPVEGRGGYATGTPAGEAYYTVQSGDTLYSIARAHNMDPRELIALAVAITTRCESCISVHAAAAAKAGATESEIAGALATAISLNAGAAYTYALRALEAVDAQR